MRPRVGLLAMSPATIDRRLAPDRAKLVLKGMSHTSRGSLLKDSIPIRTWADWDDAVPGFVEIDLVGHEGGNAVGEHCYTLTVTDIATGWTENRSLRRDPSSSVPRRTATRWLAAYQANGMMASDAWSGPIEVVGDYRRKWSS